MSIQPRFKRLALAPCLAVALLAAAPAAMAAPVQGVEIQRSTQQLENFAQSRGVLIKDIRISRSVTAGPEAGATQTSCTATATVSIPGGTGVELSATAPTCAQAIQMLQDAISEFLEP